MNKKFTALAMAALLVHMDASAFIHAMEISAETYASANESHQWKGKKVAFLGDSITDKQRIGTQKCYWEYLAEMLGIEAFSYGINGNQMDGLLKQAQLLLQEHGQETDAIIVFAGTNDFNAGVPIGKWFEEVKRDAPMPNGKKAKRTYRQMSTDTDTFCGRINRLMDYLKTNFPTQQIILLTPLHRGFAQFGDNNVQPEEAFTNSKGLFVNDYVQTIKEAGNVWAVPVIDLNSLSGLYPMNDSHVPYFHNGETDRLHPNAEGHKRMAKTLMYQMMALPSSFK
ncbi:SGNH/GDSL hydrolase family protein [Phocaeicola plebeius]|uniref:SGNH/GDSL hydrolase family protein n=1 Tax=Phocaeicola plebeius TaxID=310297 RepID=UPI0026EC590C|nr:SGNH/GDSL hydrolase family protein [Phocaeicola plebeius]